jgi:lysophospholipase L1-like esterase
VGRTKSPPILIVGDSITEAALLPSVLCKAPVINAGIGGAGTTTDFQFIIRRSLAGRKAKLIVVALGTNDAYETDAARFKTRYAAQVAHLKPFAERMLLVKIPPLSSNHLNLMQDNVAPLNRAVEAVAVENDLHVISLQELESVQSLDGVHLSDAGYAVWDKKVTEGILHECNQDSAGAAAMRPLSAK